MHELSIVTSIIEIAEREVKKAQAHSVSKIELDIGILSGVEMQAFDFAWEQAIPKTSLAGAKRVVNRLDAKSKCEDCKYQFDAESLYELCPKCDCINTVLLQGKEMKVKSLELVFEE
jgi:hydrogenase nickel incorporation protein HypA/HybF